jgi:putative transcriptional regulator
MNKYPLTVILMRDTPKSPSAAIRQKQGNTIRQYRKLRKMSQADLAAAVGVTKAAVSEWEKGYSSPRPHLQIAIAQAFDAPWNAIFGLDGAAA